MPTVSFPITITISIDVPDFLADAVSHVDQSNVWKFTAACETVPPSTPEQELPRIVTESEFPPAATEHAAACADNDIEDPDDSVAPPTPRKLTHQQRTAVLCLVRGLSLEQTAQTVGVSRNTLQRWKRENPSFQALYDSHCDDLHRSAEAKLLSLGTNVAEVLSAHVASGDFRAALQVAKGLGLLTGKPRPRLPESVELLAECEIESPFASAPQFDFRRAPQSTSPFATNASA